MIVITPFCVERKNIASENILSVYSLFLTFPTLPKLLLQPLKKFPEAVSPSPVQSPATPRCLDSGSKQLRPPSSVSAILFAQKAAAAVPE